MSVYIPHGVAGKEQSSVPENGLDPTRNNRPVEHYLCGVSSFLLAGVLTWLFYSHLVSIMLPLGMIATTAIVMTVALMWSLGWIGFELLWEWRAGRLLAS